MRYRFGLTPPLLLSGHVIGTRMAREVAALEPGAERPPLVRASPAQRHSLNDLRVQLLTGYLGLLSSVLVPRAWRDLRTSHGIGRPAAELATAANVRATGSNQERLG